MLCAWAPNTGFCRGDSGGPLVHVWCTSTWELRNLCHLPFNFMRSPNLEHRLSRSVLSPSARTSVLQKTILTFTRGYQASRSGSTKFSRRTLSETETGARPDTADAEHVPGHVSSDRACDSGINHVVRTQKSHCSRKLEIRRRGQKNCPFAMWIGHISFWCWVGVVNGARYILVEIDEENSGDLRDKPGRSYRASNGLDRDSEGGLSIHGRCCSTTLRTNCLCKHFDPPAMHCVCVLQKSLSGTQRTELLPSTLSSVKTL